MVEQPRPRRPRARGKDSPELVARLQRSHQRSLERRTAATEREKTITRAVGDYLTAWHAIDSLEHARDREVSTLREQIDAVIAHAASQTVAHEQRQAAAAAAVRELVHSDDELAELLEISVKRARQLVAAFRALDAEQTPTTPTQSTPKLVTPRARPSAAPRNSDAETQPVDEAAPTTALDDIARPEASFRTS